MTLKATLCAGACAVALVSLTAVSAIASQPPSSPAERQQTAQLNEQQLSNPGATEDTNANDNMATPASDSDNGTMRHRHHHHHAQSTSDRVDPTPGSANTDMDHDNNLPTNADGDLGNGPTDGGPRNNPGTPQPH